MNRHLLHNDPYFAAILSRRPTAADLPPHLYPRADSTLAVFSFNLTGLSDVGRCLLEYAKDHPATFAISAVLIIGGVLFLTVPVVVGFGAYGVVAGSAAAAWQSWIGNVVAGSLFAVLQKLSMTGVFQSIGIALAAMGLTMPVVPIVNQCLHPDSWRPNWLPSWVPGEAGRVRGGVPGQEAMVMAAAAAGLGVYWGV